MTVEEEKIAFRAALPQFIRETVENTCAIGGSLASEWMEKSMNYNVEENKPYRGLITVIAFKMLADKSQLTKENIEDATFVAWCSKMIEASCQMTDDIVDSTQSRAGRPSWHTLEEVKQQSVTDAIMLNSAVFVNLQLRVGDKEYYPEASKMFVQATYTYLLGQTLDYIHSKANVLSHTKEQYDHMTKLKIAIPGIYSSVALPLVMCGYKDPNIYKNAEEILIEIGRAWQRCNDYLDCFGGVANVGGTDIEENKITWLSVNAVARANADQRLILQKCYGRKDMENIEQVKLLYQQLGLKELFMTTQNECYKSISNMIESSPYAKLKPVLRIFLEFVYSLHIDNEI